MSLRKGFTLVELLVVIAVIGVLLALLLPAVQMAREAARRSECENHLKQIGIALHNHHDTFGHLPSGWTGVSPSGSPGWGWGAHSLKYMEQNNIEDLINFKLSVADPVNVAALASSVHTFHCPSATGDESFVLGGLTVGKSNYVGVFGTEEIEDAPSHGDGVMYHNSATRFLDISDGLSTTFMIGERSAKLDNSTWVGVIPGAGEAMARIVGSVDHAPNHPAAHFDDFSSMHPGGAQFVRCDGSVHFVSESIDEVVYSAYATREGEENIPGLE
ncbi:DUF1559 family PulG-like putative transporter [Lignipirellula cremea]|uniref:DUF1559 domain-containing protein n=1 Tax=Lignipirellula cremea TaxID=2528010 RepID=A0A518E1U7_9BACT|nr:DUF1559 domain-containing protein [Lignipirellula cremea]QDU98065.1 hypothetical protein Pla8534_59260 [Lignipirellula cremea]